MARRQNEAPSDASLKGWNAIAGYLGQPVATAQRWAKTGMPVRRVGKFVVSEPEELSRWLGRESGLNQPAHVAHTGEPDLIADLKLGLKATRKERPSKKRKR